MRKSTATKHRSHVAILILKQKNGGYVNVKNDSFG